MKKIIIASCMVMFSMTGVAFAQTNEVAVNEKSVSARAEQAMGGDRGATSSAQSNSVGKADEHRSEVAKFVQALLATSTRIGGIGEEVRKIAQEQASSTEKVAVAIEKIEERSKVKTFLIGSDYKNIGAIRSEIVTTENRLARLSREVEKIASSTEKTAITAEIQSLKEEQVKLETFVKTNESKFSIFGWVVRLFQK